MSTATVSPTRKQRFRMTQAEAIAMADYIRKNWERFIELKMTHQQAANEFSVIREKEFSPASVAYTTKTLGLQWPSVQVKKEVSEARKSTTEYKMTTLTHNVEALRKFLENLAEQMGSPTLATEFGYDHAVVHRIVSYQPLPIKETTTA